jgi:hypothetical protein
MARRVARRPPDMSIARADAARVLRRRGYAVHQLVREGGDVANPVPAGSDVSAGTYKCTQCGYDLDVTSTQHLPPCPSCGNGQWDTISGGDSVDDPYPNRS